MCAKSVAPWKMIVFASSMERAEHVGARRGDGVEVREVRGPRREHTGREDWAQRVLKDPKAIFVVVSARSR